MVMFKVSQFDKFKKYVNYLNDNFHSKNEVHGNVVPENLNLEGVINKTLADSNFLLPFPFRHPDILISGKAKNKYHDYYALFATALFIFTGKFLNSPDCPILDYVEMREKLFLFKSFDLINLKDDQSEQKVIDYLYRLMFGEIII